MVVAGYADAANTYGGTGTATFDDAGILTIVSAINTTLPALGGSATIFATQNIQGTIDGSGIFTSNGNTSGSITGCTGSNTYVCGQLGTLPSMSNSDDGAIFSVDINAGGSWDTEIVQGPATIFATEILTPVPIPAAAWLFGSALLGLAGASRKRKA